MPTARRHPRVTTPKRTAGVSLVRHPKIFAYVLYIQQGRCAPSTLRGVDLRAHNLLAPRTCSDHIASCDIANSCTPGLPSFFLFFPFCLTAFQIFKTQQTLEDLMCLYADWRALHVSQPRSPHTRDCRRPISPLISVEGGCNIPFFPILSIVPLAWSRHF